ncbi:MAG: hypothetical protein WKG32_14795 [Gemmatimonadaceae bacterium]
MRPRVVPVSAPRLPPPPPPPPLPPLPPLPVWVRALLAVANRAPPPLARLASALCDETLLAWLPRARRAEVTTAIFARQDTYAPGGGTFTRGLFAWERELLARPEVPSAGRVLVGGAGGGREAVALRDLGYEVLAFEPAEPLVRAGVPAVSARPGASLVCASYDDLVRAAGEGTGPLAGLRSGPRIDAVLLGWGSFSHVMADAERLAILRATRVLAPAAPLLLSFDEPTVLDAPGSAASRLRAGLRQLFVRVGAPTRVREGERFAPWAGFFRESTAAETTALAREAGYHVAYVAGAPGRAVLLPA